MKISTINSLILSEEELAALATADAILKKFQDIYDDSVMLHSHATDEVVRIGELGRVRGVITFFENVQTFSAERRYTNA